MKRIKNLLFLFGVLVILAIAYFIIVTLTADSSDETDTSDTDATISTSYTAAQVDLATVYSLKYNVGEDKYCFSLNDSQTAWIWDGNTSLPLDSQYFASMATELQLISSTVKMSVDKSSLSTYGLDDPWLTISVSDETFGAQTFMFGTLNSFNDQYYFTTSANTSLVYMVDSSIAEQFIYAPNDMVQNDEMPEISTDSIFQLSFKSVADEWIYTYYVNGKDDSTDTKDLWYVSKKVGEETALDEEIGAGLCDAIASLSLSDLAGYTEDDKKALGLDEPTVMTVSYVTQSSVTDDNGNTTTVSVDSTLQLNLGYSDGEGSVYANLPDSVLSYKIDGTVLEGLYNAIISSSSAN